MDYAAYIRNRITELRDLSDSDLLLLLSIIQRMHQK